MPDHKSYLQRMGQSRNLWPVTTTGSTIESLLQAQRSVSHYNGPLCSQTSSHVKVRSSGRGHAVSHSTVWLLLVDKGLLTAAGTGQGSEQRCRFASRICRVDPPASKQASHRRLSSWTVCLLTSAAPVLSGFLARTALARRGQTRGKAL